MQIFQPDTLSWAELALRLAAATVLPFAIGLERYTHNKPVDFRPFVIISVTACALLIGADELVNDRSDSDLNLDPIRVIEGVITGIGFMGAGAMFREGNFVQGAGSAAAIWCAGAIGLLCGIGEIWLAAIVTSIVLVLLVASRPFTEKWDPSSNDGDGAPD